MDRTGFLYGDCWSKYSRSGIIRTFVLILSFTASISVFAFEDDGTWSSGSFYSWSGGGVGPTVSLACSNMGSVYWNDGGHRCGAYTSYHLNQYACNPSNPTYGGCDLAPASNCPTSGDILQLTVKTVSTLGGESVSLTGSEAPPIVKDSCTYTPQSGQSGETVSVECFPIDGSSTDIECFNTMNFVATGDSYTGETIDSAQAYDPGSEDDPQPISGATLDTRTSTKDLQVIPTDIVVFGDGTTQETDQNILTEVAGNGSKINTSETQTVVTDTNGIAKTTTTTTQTVTNPDGSQTVTETTNVSYTNNPVTNYTITNEGDVTKIETSPGSNASQTTTQTTNKDSQGNVTGQSETTESDGTGEEVPEDGAFCEENTEDPSCKEYDGAADGGLYTAGTETFTTVLDRFKTNAMQSPVMTAATEFFTLNANGSCTPWVADTWVFHFVFDFHCISPMTDIYPLMALVLLAVASVLAFRIAFL